MPKLAPISIRPYATGVSPAASAPVPSANQKFRRRSLISASNTPEHASVLLEVVLALALFVAAATVITAGINASTQAVQRVRLQNHAANLAISLMSELQMHARPLAPIGPETFEPPFKDWLYRIAVEQGPESIGEGPSLRPVEVIVWNPEEGITHRITQFFRPGEFASAESSAETIVP